ncbi:MAG: hypothetical protein WCH65_06090 [bacterium]
MLENHNAIIEEPIENIVQKYGPKEGIEIIRKHLLIEINKQRAKEKLPKLVEEACLTNAAQSYATFLENNNSRYYDDDGNVLHDPHIQYIGNNVIELYQRIENT